MSAELPRDVGCLEWWKALRTCTDPALTKGIRAVLWPLSTWADYQTGGSCYPTQRLVAIAVGMKEKTVQRLLSRAERLGWLRSWSVPVPGKRVSFNRYQLTLPGTAVLPLRKPRHRSTAGSLSRGKAGKFLSTTPLHSADDTAVHALTTPLHSGNTSPLIYPRPPNGGRSTSDDQLRARVLRLVADGHDDATIAGLLFQHEVPEATIRQWRAESSIPF